MDNRRTIRVKLLGLLTRTQLDEISGVVRPWGYDRPSLTTIIVDGQWPSDDIYDVVLNLLEKSK